MSPGKPIHTDGECFRGRSRDPKCLFGKSSLVSSGDTMMEEPHNESKVFNEEWFNGNLEIGSENESNDAIRCSCGQRIRPGDVSSGSVPVSIKMSSYPPYLTIPASEAILVKGSTSQLIMQLLANDVPPPKIARMLAKQNPTERYSTGEAQAIMFTCSRLGLDGRSPSATRSIAESRSGAHQSSDLLLPTACKHPTWLHVWNI